MRISDWSSDVCSSDLRQTALERPDARLRQMLRGAGRTEPRVVRRIDDIGGPRSEERRVGEEWMSTWRSRWATDHYIKQVNRADNSWLTTNTVTLPQTSKLTL